MNGEPFSVVCIHALRALYLAVRPAQLRLVAVFQELSQKPTNLLMNFRSWSVVPASQRYQQECAQITFRVLI